MVSSTSGTLRVQITCADMSGFLGKLNNCGITVQGLYYVDLLTVTLDIDRINLQRTEKIAASCGATIKIIQKNGIYWTIRRWRQRPVLIIGLCVLLFLSAWLPTRVLFVTVEGNKTIPDQLIIEQANRCGIVFGASRREVRSEKMKNNLLSAIPSLQWAGINTSGCTAVISVKERSEKNQDQILSGVSSIVAVRDGIIESCTSSKGSIQCKPGQAVVKGQVLISGYTDLGLFVKVTCAEGEVYAQTKHELAVLSPAEYMQKGEYTSVQKKYGILIGKKRINFNKCSGISGAGCDRIYLDYYVTLPGGFQLPIGFFVNITTAYAPMASSVSPEKPEELTEQAAKKYLLSQMVSGKILQQTVSVHQEDDVWVLSGRYVCSEMIGRLQHEEIYEGYGEDN